MKSIDVPQKGKRGKVVASRNHFGPYLKEFVPPNQPGTASQRGAWGNMAELSWMWNELGDERRTAWRRLALQVRSRPNMGKPAPLKEWRKLKDKRYHLPLEDSRIFIRVWQQVNGFENEVGMFLANALVPARTWPGWAGKKRQD